ncbi:response regulator transcription factor [Cupriavidus basilensis]|uniref:Response regulator transcription factor n=1 Tax=Cupriavidus basilensis TaxID=68895 RepID=A0ABT6ASS1_9BURK|nr:response regulator transcription factor [Cupriavidus basilensis]MDF3835665.1 response regulator transcription factor [Cupriavidus basilensis]
MSRIVIVDDHPLISVAVRLMLEKEGHTIVAECTSGSECIQAVREHSPDLVILDLGIPKMDGFAVISHFKATDTRVKTLVLTSGDPRNFAIRCLQAGAAGFVSKDDDLNELVAAVRAVLSGYIYFPESAVSMLRESGQAAGKEQDLIASLSDREITILKLLAKGLSNQEIAEDLLISHKTVSTYKVRLMRKLNVSNLVAMVEIAKRNGLV